MQNTPEYLGQHEHFELNSDMFTTVLEQAAHALKPINPDSAALLQNLVDEIQGAGKDVILELKY